MAAKHRHTAKFSTEDKKTGECGVKISVEYDEVQKTPELLFKEHTAASRLLKEHSGC